ncbi:MAG TPA: PAS domain S-box protein [Holophagaceae bacterium]|nr:PAS domain S-box protein [Holophagaceae bacterium]
MSPFVWDSQLETGLAEVDQDHRHLVGLVNRIGELWSQAEPTAPQEGVEAIDDLVTYTRHHFATEEHLMALHGVDARHLERHRAEHERLTRDLMAFHDPGAPPDEAQVQRLGRFVSHWLVAHILGTDLAMGRQVRAIQDGMPPASAFEALEAEPDGASRFLLEAIHGLYDALSDRNRQLLQFRTHLEAEVASRTRALRTANESLTRSLEDLTSAQTELHVKDARYQAAVNASLDGFWVADGEGRLLDVNEAYCRASGYSRAQLLAMRIPDLEAKEHPEETAAHIRRVMTEGSDIFETLHRKASGEVWPVEILVTYSSVDGGRLLVFIRDISVRKAAEEALSASEHRFRNLFYEAPVGHALNRLEDGSFLSVNPAFAAITGYDLAELNALSYWDLTPPEYEAQEAQQLASLKAFGRYGPYEKEYLRKNGTRVPVLLNGSLIHDSDGTPLILSVVSDITENVRSRRVKDDFVSLVSHELRTPLTSIRGGVSLALSGALGPIPEKVGEVLRISETNCQRLTRLVNDILDIQRIERGQLDLHLRDLALGPLVEQALRENRPFAERHGVPLTLQDAAPGLVLHTDPDRITQILVNLISNAVKFSPEGSPVLLSIWAADGGAWVSVADRGPGIPEEFQPRIYEKFTQAGETNTREQQGSGLGLSIVKALVELLRGRIAFESSPGIGTTFRVWFPGRATDSPTP